MNIERGPSRLAAFDGLRAFAAFSVLAYHVSLACALTRAGPFARAFAELKSGVVIFFVISGFLLYRPHARALCSGDALPSWREFASRRAARILPAYWVALTVLALTSVGASVLTSDGWRFYLLAQIYKPDMILAGMGVAWSLCVEVSFYALLPIFAVGMARLVRGAGPLKSATLQLRMLLVLALGSGALRLLLGGGPLGTIPQGAAVAATALPGCLDWFAAGMALGVLAGAREAGHPVLPRLTRMRPGLCWTLGLLSFLIAAAVQREDLFLGYYGLIAHVAVGVGATLFVLPALRPVRPTDARPLRLLTRPIVVWLGTVSYGVYLWHVSVITALGQLMPRIFGHPHGVIAAVTLVVLTAVVGVALGSASWYLIERPSIRRLTPVQRRTAVPAAARAAHV